MDIARDALRWERAGALVPISQMCPIESRRSPKKDRNPFDLEGSYISEDEDGILELSDLSERRNLGRRLHESRERRGIRRNQPI